MKATVSVNSRLKDLPEAMLMQNAEMKTIRTDINSAFMKHERRLFATEGRAGGGRWAPLSPKYKKWKAKKYPGRKILSASGKLRKALTQKAPPHIARHTHGKKASVTVGAESIVAAYHAPSLKGKNPFRPNPRLPVRDPMAHTNKQMRAYTAIVKDYLIRTKWPRIERTLKAAPMRRVP